MNAKSTIRKVLFISFWVIIGGGMLSLLIAAIGRQKKDHCKGYVIRVKGGPDNLFVDEKDVFQMLKSAVKGSIKGQPKSSFNLLRIEQALEKNVWVKDAELYFDNKDVLHVSVEESEPIARIFTKSGRSFYINETEKIMPLSDKLSAKVPVFTGFPEKVLSSRDSALLQDVSKTASFILHDPFWMAQVAQIDIGPENDFEMVPVVGNHVVLLGKGENIERKFHRLFIFYKEVLSRSGFDLYKTINVQYAGQVIGVKEKQGAKTDTAQLRLNIERMLKQARDMQNDSLIAARQITQQKEIRADPEIAATERTTTADGNNDPAESNPNPVLVTNPVPMKPFIVPGSQKPKPVKERTPKAVMPRREQ